MRPSRVGTKRERDTEAEEVEESHNEDFTFIHGLRLSQNPSQKQKDLFQKKLKKIGICIAKSLHPTDFEDYTIRERFVKMGWEQLLSFNCDKLYRHVVIQWAASLSRNGDELTGLVDGKSYTITPVVIRDVLGVDTRTDSPYDRFKEVDFLVTSDEMKRRWVEAYKTVFGVKEVVNAVFTRYPRSKMTPLVKILWQIGVSTFYPRLGDGNFEYLRTSQIHLLYALFTGEYLYSFAHLMIDDIWDMYHDKNRQNIPYGSYISEILNRLGAMPENESVDVVAPENRLISRKTFLDLDFSESTTEYIIRDRLTEQRVTFPKKVIEGETPPHPMPITNPHSDMTELLTNVQNLIMKQSSQSQDRQNEIVSLVTNIQKQMELQVLEAERREREGKRLAEESEKRAEEREKKAEIRAHAIIWDIERHRYFYEQEQEQMRMAWNQINGFNEFQFPQIPRISLHPAGVGSRYYDPTQGGEIPKEFQSLYHDIYGP